MFLWFSQVPAVDRCEPAATAFRSGQFERAIELGRLCVDQGLENGEIYKLLALSSYVLQRFDDFQTYMNRAIVLSPGDSAPHYHLGRFFYEKKRYREALTRFRRAIELDPENYRAYYFSGLCRQGNNDEAGALDDYRKAIKIIDSGRIKYGWPFADLADLLVLRGELDQGVSWAYRAVRNDPTLPYAHYVYAAALMKVEASFEVEQELTRAIQLDPGYTQAYYLLGRYYTKTGNKEKANAAFAKFEELRKTPQPSPFGLRR
jgi:tetratricopeptide (TPR) repeat protein